MEGSTPAEGGQLLDVLQSLAHAHTHALVCCMQAGLQADTAIYNGILRLLADRCGRGGNPGALEAIVAEMEAGTLRNPLQLQCM